MEARALDELAEGRRAEMLEQLGLNGFYECAEPLVLQDFPGVLVDDRGMEVSVYEVGEGGEICLMFGLPVTSERVASYWGYDKRYGGEFFKSVLSWDRCVGIGSMMVQVGAVVLAGRRLIEYAKCHDCMEYCKVGDEWRGIGEYALNGAAAGIPVALLAGLDGVGFVWNDLRRAIEEIVTLPHTPEGLQDLWYRFVSLGIYMPLGALVGLAVWKVIEGRPESE